MKKINKRDSKQIRSLALRLAGLLEECLSDVPEDAFADEYMRSESYDALLSLRDEMTQWLN